MKLSFLLIPIFCVLQNAIFSQNYTFTDKAKKLIGTFSVYHYSPITINDNTSGEIVDLFIKELDNTGLILTQNDVSLLQKDKSQLLNQINNGDDTYFKNAQTIYSKAFQTVDSLLQYLSSKKINFLDNDTSYFLGIGSDISYSSSLKKHAKRLEKNIKRRSLERVANTDGYEKLTEQEFNAKAVECSHLVLNNFYKNIKEMLLEVPKTVESTLLNAIALRHDPHSNYFTKEQNKEFNTQLSAKVESFGFKLGEDEDETIMVVYIEPGGSAWMSNDVNEGDLFVSVKIGGALYTNEGYSAFDIQDKLDKTDENKIQLTLKTQNGQLKTTKLIKQKMSSQDNAVKGYILKNAFGNIGYISLPSFYTDMDQNIAPGCANDVAKEILKLEQDTITGLIIDLRNNGGGSMSEAMNLAGIFVDEGPLFIFKEKTRKPYLMKDSNRGSIFKKPLVVMINEMSASASELFSNIIKDYNIGVIVGQISYGKGTSQNVLPLDTNVLRFKNGMETTSDFIKITNGKFYRLNCSTHQGVGLVPDIILPSSPGYSIYKEGKEAFFIKPDVITKNVIFSPNPAINISLLQQKSSARIQSSPNFNSYKQKMDSISIFLNNPQNIVLKYKEFKLYKSYTDNLFKSYETVIQNNGKDVKCINNTFDKKIAELNEQTKEFNTKIRESIEKDIFIIEAFNVVNNLIEISK